MRNNYKQHDEEDSPTYTERQSMRLPSSWSEVERASDTGKVHCANASHVELIEMRRPSKALIIDSDSSKEV
jgi:hypothetical protein